MFKNTNNLKKRFAQIAATGAAIVPAISHAALDTAVTDSITATQADIVQAGGLLIGLAVVGLGLRWVKGMFF
jgi:hypothetical protein